MEITCSCGCGQTLELLDNRGRLRRFIHGHNARNPSPETRRKFRKAATGQNNAFYGKSHSKKTRTLMKKNHRGMAGKIHSEQTKQKQRDSNPKIWLGKRGKETPNWRGGINPLCFTIRGCLKMKGWRMAVFERDKFTCTNCGDNKGGNLNAHHIKSFVNLLKLYKITTFEAAEKCSELWKIEGGKTLCVVCHRGLHCG